VSRARAARPAILIDASLFADYVDARLGANADQSTLSALHGADLYLAYGCALRLAAAITAFETEVMEEVNAALRRLRLQRATVDDLSQLVRQKLLMGNDGGQGKIGEYSGRGPLTGWARVVATRLALNMLREKSPESPVEDALLDAVVVPGGSPAELEYLRQRYEADLRQAFARAMETLTAEHRLLLRQRYLDGLTTGDLARLHGGHRITIARRIEKLLRGLRLRTTGFLERGLGCDKRAAESIVNQMLPEMDLSIERYLRP
jgi:RNA polymerase sigma-70 factor (ECF subfamily)